VQIPQGIQRDSRRPKGHAGADAGVEHPVRQYCYDARLDLNVNDAAGGALLAVMGMYTSAVEWTPAPNIPSIESRSCYPGIWSTHFNHCRTPPIENMYAEDESPIFKTCSVTRVLLLAGASVISAACCPGGNCDYAFRPNYEARHKVFVQNLNAWIGRPFNHVCLREGNCPPQTLESGLVRYTAVDWRPWLKGCTFWYDVDPATQIVKAVGYRGSDTQCSSGPLR
jgi:hypothetical protein